MKGQPKIAYPRHPATLDPFVEVLGPALTVRFLVEFGGAKLYFPNDPRGRSAAEQLIGLEHLRSLGQRLSESRQRIPMCKPWLSHAMKAEGKSVAEIARSLKWSDVSVRKALHNSPHGASDGAASTAEVEQPIPPLLAIMNREPR